MSDELKPCPFCGLVPVKPEAIEHNGDESYYVQCTNLVCCAEGPYIATKEGAIEQWNNRAKPRFPWRKVSDGEKPKENRRIAVWRGDDKDIRFINWIPGSFAGRFFRWETHWCYASELKPEDAE